MKFDRYLRELSNNFFNYFKEEATSLYAGGSYSQDDFCSESDFDIYGFIKTPRKHSDFEDFKELISHKRLPIPSKGLEFHIVEYPIKLVREPKFIFVLSDGETWNLEVEHNYSVGENLIGLRIIKDSGVLIQGHDVRDSIPVIPNDWLRMEVQRVIEWHKGKVHDSFHDPLGYQSVLNACRALYFMKTNKFVSKSYGGKWYISEFSDYANLVKKALDSRLHSHEKLTYSEVIDFLNLTQKNLNKY